MNGYLALAIILCLVSCAQTEPASPSEPMIYVPRREHYRAIPRRNVDRRLKALEEDHKKLQDLIAKPPLPAIPDRLPE